MFPNVERDTMTLIQFCCAVLILATVAFTDASEQSRQAVILGVDTRLRADRNTHSTVMKLINRGVVVRILGKWDEPTTTWYKISTEGDTGWVAGELLHEFIMPDSQPPNVPTPMPAQESSPEGTNWLKYDKFIAAGLGVLLTVFFQVIVRKITCRRLVSILGCEAESAVERCLYIIELTAVGSLSHASLPRSARDSLLSKLADVAPRQRHLRSLIEIYNMLDRVSVHQDSAVQRWADGDENGARQAQGRAAAFARGVIGPLLTHLLAIRNLEDEGLLDRCRLLTDIEKAAGWPGYVAVCRVFLAELRKENDIGYLTSYLGEASVDLQQVLPLLNAFLEIQGADVKLSYACRSMASKTSLVRLPI